MRRVLNLNHPGTIFVKIIGLFAVAIPTVLYGILLLWNEPEIVRTLLLSMIRISFGIAAFVLIVLLVLIAAEQIQDHYIDVQYQKNRDRKLLLANGNYECQYCGNQKIKESDKTCPVCGRELR
ncbi:MAG TPA: zinc ribbon domain-containing protein [Anaerolineales bacterium]|nr:zinc ribbon domain-containing protein [Anaerolineales bacterium]